MVWGGTAAAADDVGAGVDQILHFWGHHLGGFRKAGLAILDDGHAGVGVDEYRCLLIYLADGVILDGL